ncbi:MAG TPA: hypothetical protein V6D23_16995 [Candidatus Obscuribacterales bacterium]
MSSPFAESCDISLKNNMEALLAMPSEHLLQALKHLRQQPGASGFSPAVQAILADIGRQQDVRAALAKCPAKDLEAFTPVVEPGFKTVAQADRPAYKAILNLFVSTYFKYHFKG